MPYFSNAPGPTPCEQLPHPMSILEKIKNKSDALAKNGANGKRKHSDENLGFILYSYIIFYKFYIPIKICFKFIKAWRKNSIFENKINQYQQ